MWPFRKRWCPRSLKAPPKDTALGFQRRTVCPGCGRAIKVSKNGRFTRHVRVPKAGRDYLDPEWKLSSH
jgi:hypothetical protein